MTGELRLRGAVPPEARAGRFKPRLTLTRAMRQIRTLVCDTEDPESGTGFCDEQLKVLFTRDEVELETIVCPGCGRDKTEQIREAAEPFAQNPVGLWASRPSLPGETAGME